MKAKKALRKLVKLVAWGIVALVVMIGIWLGFIDPKKMKMKAELAAHNLKSETVDVLKSGPPSANANSAMCAESCRQNLRRIESAKRALHSRGMFATGSVSIDAVSKEMRGMPTCPCGGRYSLGTLQQLPMCSMASGGTVDAADNHILQSY